MGFLKIKNLDTAAHSWGGVYLTPSAEYLCQTKEEEALFARDIAFRMAVAAGIAEVSRNATVFNNLVIPGILNDILDQLTVVDNQLRGSIQLLSSFVVSATTIFIDEESPRKIYFTGSASDQEVRLPKGTVVPIGTEYEFYNESSRVVFIREYDGTILLPLEAGQALKAVSIRDDVVVGNWYYSVLTKTADGHHVENIVLDPSQIAAKQVVLLNVPTEAVRTLVDIDEGGGTRFYGLDFTISGNVLSWNGLRLDGLLAVGDRLRVVYTVLPKVVSRYVDQLELTTAIASAKQITLQNYPSEPSSTLVDVDYGGGARFYGVDFVVSGNVLSWTGLRLDGLLSDGDRLRIVYY